MPRSVWCLDHDSPPVLAQLERLRFLSRVAPTSSACLFLASTTPCLTLGNVGFLLSHDRQLEPRFFRRGFQAIPYSRHKAANSLLQLSLRLAYPPLARDNLACSINA